MSHAFLLGVSGALLVGGAVVCLAAARHRVLCGWIATAASTASAALLVAVAAGTFRAGAEPEVPVLGLPALGAAWTVVVDPLSALFLVIAAVICALSALYSVRYMTQFAGDSVGKFYPVLLLFFASVQGVLVTSDLLFFIAFWEAMTLTSFFLITFERESATSQRAGRKYFIVTHAATLAMVAAALVVWKRSGSFHFDAVRDALGGMLAAEPVAANVAIALLAIGFATKAGILPMGDWLPDAHPVAPSGMSAALSGALVKIGIYGLLRLFCGFVPVSGTLRAWGVVVALAGAGSLFAGTLTALAQTDSKRLMAFHTIGQIGYIALGLGVGLYCLPDAPALAALALMGALFHAVNHACFKACLFLGAGAVLFRTGRRDMDRLGGLAAAMPVTAGSSGIASLSIAGVPPLNGFASKWLILATCLMAGLRAPLFLALGIVGLFISLATLASFLKVIGAVFLGQPADDPGVREVPPTMVVPQVILAALCVLLGLFPYAPLQLTYAAVAGTARVALPPLDALVGTSWGLSLATGGAGVAAWAPLTLAGVLVLLGALAFALQHAGAAKVRRVEVWTCGEPQRPALVRYPATSLFQPFKHAFHGVYPAVRVRAPAFPPAVRRALDLDRWLYGPVARAVERTATGAGRTHAGIPQLYLLWIVMGAAAVVGIALWAMR